MFGVPLCRARVPVASGRKVCGFGNKGLHFIKIKGRDAELSRIFLL